MVAIKISDDIRSVLGKVLTIGYVEAQVEVKDSNEKLWEEISTVCNRIAEDNSLQDVLKIENIAAARAAYKKLGKDPSRYRVSSESLARRVVKGKGLYKVNNIVDINNLISIASFHPVCAYDMDKIDSEIYLNIGEEGDCYEGIGRGDINISCLPVFQDSKGKFGSTTSDSVRAMVTKDTKNLIMAIVSFNGDRNLDKYIEYCKELLVKYAEGKNIHSGIIS
ncbi:phenylalanine--tRNA ligase beta subunit-related protein [Clostridium sp. CX1]|uniref:B3/B4 domain-containing protein n=1 Tax=Clostridium sp. CX1 TaxID=2978346 RepID=UPI0021C19DCC|nr:phenylalanine--tRNA ligase beta subunit-related protein [Clostridium sp. CX1]MCT8975431.1 phenylalanine--tRNA ligase beta subunit-related protein [Clostridium sp. CX1]